MSINIVWLKRDLRLSDHQPLWRAFKAGKPVILLYIVEDILLADEHYSERHWRFIYQSLNDMALRLAPSTLWVRQGDALNILQQIHHDYEVDTIFSHQEVGLLNTFERDIAIAHWCKADAINWRQSRLGAVKRGLRSRNAWDKDWQDVMRADTLNPPIEQMDFVKDTQLVELPKAWQINDENFQTGGESTAFTVLEDFYLERGQSYQRSISSPSLSRVHCSRLSPYLAWGNISLRQVYQSVLLNWNKKGWRRALIAFSSRLHWHCHFVQKFESEHQMEFEHVNRGYQSLPYQSGEVAQQHYLAWQSGNTGYPMVDACMRCLHATGYINFRMRAMLVSFLCHHLQLDWRMGVKHLARLFLDFEPGIHYSQFQMQAGVTGINTIRIYNPVKQSQDNDVDAAFITQWLPALEKLPVELRHQPWLLTPMEQGMYEFELGKDYPEPIIDIGQSAKQAKDLLWQWRKRGDVKKEAARLLARHVRPSKGKSK